MTAADKLAEASKYGSVCDVFNGSDEEDAANTAFIAAAHDMMRLCDKLMAEREEAKLALQGILDRYVDLVNSGDVGNWDCEEEPQVIAARAILAKMETK